MFIWRKFEIRHSKSETNSKHEEENSKPFDDLEFRISDLFRISIFDIRIYWALSADNPIAAVVRVADDHPVAAGPFKHGLAATDDGVPETYRWRSLTAGGDAHGNFVFAIGAGMADDQNDSLGRRRRAAIPAMARLDLGCRHGENGSENQAGENQFDGCGHGRPP
jgi:hypothetical protein